MDTKKNKDKCGLNHCLVKDFSAGKYADLQFANPDKIKKIQTQLFLQHLEYTLGQSSFYKDLYTRKKIDLARIQSIDDIGLLPLTHKEDLLNTNDLLCTDKKEIVDICLTSATSSATPTLIPQTSSDLSRLAYNEELAFSMTGINETDTILVCAALDRCFMAGMAYFLGGTKLSATMVRAGSGSPAQHWELIKLTKATVIVGVPSLMYKIGQYGRQNHGDPKDCGVKRLIAIGEPTKDETLRLLPIARELETMWKAKIYSTYASSEMATTFCECEARSGGHTRPELIIVEILGDDDQPVKPGEKGEIVVTPLGITGMPLIRFKTGDISYMIQEKCPCKRTSPRLAPVLGRKNQMLKYKGTTIFPNAVLAALEGDKRFYNGYIEAKKNSDGTDRIILYTALAQEDEPDTWIREVLQAKLRVVPEIRLITRQEADKKVYQFDKKRKRMTFFDLRKKDFLRMNRR
ncbi:MAG: phenylacetate--CoA ligase [Desulfobacteraceae bacterium]|nr:phenylacetate--CoA ligase [Desulfobacteraceae bacterium]